MRYVLDANVIIDAALDPTSPAASLELLSPGPDFFTSVEICAEVDRKLVESAPDTLRLQAGRYLVRRFLLALGVGVEHAPTPPSLAHVHDGHVVACHDATGSDAVITRNTKDFQQVPAITPVNLLRDHKFFDWSIELPPQRYLPMGTFAIAGRFWPGESFGWFLSDRAGVRIGLGSDGRLESEGGELSRSRSLSVPHGQSVVIVCRWKDARAKCHFSTEGSADLHGLGEVSLLDDVRMVALSEPGHGWNGEIFWSGYSAHHLGDKQVKRMLRLETRQGEEHGVTDIRAALSQTRLAPIPGTGMFLILAQGRRQLLFARLR